MIFFGLKMPQFESVIHSLLVSLQVPILKSIATPQISISVSDKKKYNHRFKVNFSTRISTHLTQTLSSFQIIVSV